MGCIESGTEGQISGDETQEAAALGRRIRAARRARELTLQDVAARAGVSRSMLSQVERGLASPSVASLRSVAAAIGVPVGSFFYEPRGTPPPPGTEQDPEHPFKARVVRVEDRLALHLPRSRVRYELLNPAVDRQVEFLWIEYGPGDSTSHPHTSHDGEENVVCLEGTLAIVLDGHEFLLHPGDSVSFDGTRPHRMENRSTERAVVVAAISPPTF